MERYWQAVLERDQQFDGQFVTAVKTTGIYCRPSCPARHPKRKNVEFYPDPDAAEAAGFRPCRRCHPRDLHPAAELVEQVCRYIEDHFEDSPTLADISKAVSVSPYHLQRVFKKVMGMSPRQYAEKCRLERFKVEVQNGQDVTRAIFDAGYNSSSRLYEQAPAQLGMTPSTYRNGGKGMVIRYTIEDSPLGRMLVAVTERGVCAISFWDSDQRLVNALQAEFPAAELRRDNRDLGAYVNEVLYYLNGSQPHIDLPLDIRATAFQQQVWEALRQIPYGETRSYSELARAIGKPKAARAVAHACATNRIAVAIPCHRIVRENGDLGGYRWGIERKRVLLEQEEQLSAEPVAE